MKTLLLFLFAFHLFAAPGGELRFSLRLEPKSFNPLTVQNESDTIIRYLTAGVLIRVNRLTQELEPELAVKWSISEDNRRIDFELRPGVRFSDGTPFGCEDVAYTVHQVMNPGLISEISDSFRTGPGDAVTKCANPLSGMIRFPASIASLPAHFDELAILSSRSPKKEQAVLGPFLVGEYKPGYSVTLLRNPNYWKRGQKGEQLPYLQSIRLDIQQNRDTEALRFRRGQLDLIGKLDPELFEQIASEMPKSAIDIGPSLDWELVFFNQVPSAPIEAHKKAWFRSTAFRRAISEAINRQDICRIVYHGHALPGAGPISPSNRFWVNTAVKPHPYSPESALNRLAKDGFRLTGNQLRDRDGHPVEFSMITNSGNKLHERTMSLIQQDLSKIGIRLNVVTLDFPSLAERISRSFNYESCLMAFTSIDLDPDGQINIWPSSASNHQWNPSQKTPSTPWEAEVDKLMLAQHAAADLKKRKASFDRVQEIVSEQAPFLFLVYPNALAAISPRVHNVTPALVFPQLYWNADRLYASDSH